MKNKMLISTTLAVLLLSLSACTSVSSNPSATAPASTPAAASDTTSATSSTSGAAAEYTYKLGYGGAVTNPRHINAEKFANWVGEQTQGRVKIDLYPSEMLGPDSEMAEMCSMGTLDMTINATGVVANYEPKIAVLELPFLFAGYDKVDQVLDSEIGESLLESLPEKGLRSLAYWENGLRQITNSKRPIEAPADLKGLKIRTPENKMTLAIFNALGANPSPLAFSELYLALSQGSFDGQENPIANIHASKFDEVQAYLTMSSHKYECLVFLVSEQVWQEMPADVQAVIAEGAKKFGIEHRTMVRSEEDSMIQDLESKGMQVNRPDLVSFQEATASVYSQFEPDFGKELIDSIVAAAK